MASWHQAGMTLALEGGSNWPRGSGFKSECAEGADHLAILVNTESSVALHEQSIGDLAPSIFMKPMSFPQCLDIL